MSTLEEQILEVVDSTEAMDITHLRRLVQQLINRYTAAKGSAEVARQIRKHAIEQARLGIKNAHAKYDALYAMTHALFEANALHGWDDPRTQSVAESVKALIGYSDEPSSDIGLTEQEPPK